jgi:chromosome segregation ATPase
VNYDAGNFWVAIVTIGITALVTLFPVVFALGRSSSRIDRLEEAIRNRDDADERMRKVFDSKIDRVNSAIERLAEVQSNATRMLAVYAERLDGYAKQLDMLREGES